MYECTFYIFRGEFWSERTAQKQRYGRTGRGRQRVRERERKKYLKLVRTTIYIYIKHSVANYGGV